MSLRDIFGPNIKKLENEKDILGLIKIFMDEKSEKLVQAAVDAIVRIGKPSVPNLIELLDSQIEKSSKKARNILHMLEDIGWKPSNKKHKRDVLYLKGKWFKLAEQGDPRAIPGLFYDQGPTVGDARKAVAALGKIKSPLAVEALKLKLKSKPGMVGKDAIAALGQIKDFGAMEILVERLQDTRGGPNDEKAAQTLEEIGWGPTTIEEEYNFLRAKWAWSKIVELGQPIVKFLVKEINEDLKKNRIPTAAIQALGRIGGSEAVQVMIEVLEQYKNEEAPSSRRYSPDFSEEAAKALAQTGDKRSAEVVMIYLMNNPCRWEAYNKEYISSFSRLFEDFTHIIIRIALYDHDLADYKWTYNLNPNLEALEELCSIHNDISNMILHIVARRNDFLAPVKATAYSKYFEGEVNIQPLRDKANEELKRRGNPVYDKSAYLDEANWLFK